MPFSPLEKRLLRNTKLKVLTELSTGFRFSNDENADPARPRIDRRSIPTLSAKNLPSTIGRSALNDRRPLPAVRSTRRTTREFAGTIRGNEPHRLPTILPSPRHAHKG